jgi:hypothetical protein
MTDDNRAGEPERVARLRDEIHRVHQERLELSGHLSSTTELLRGGRLFRQSLLDDGLEYLREYIPLMQSCGDGTAALVDALEQFHDTFTAQAAYAAAKAAQALMDSRSLPARTVKLSHRILDVHLRCMYYAWLLGSRQAARHVAAMAFDLAMDSPGELAQVEFLGTAIAAGMARGTFNRERAHADGIATAARLGGLAQDYLTAKGSPTDEQKGKISQAVGKALRRLMDNPAGEVQADIYQVLPEEPVLGDGEIEVDKPAPKGRIVFPAFEVASSSTDGRRTGPSAFVRSRVGHVAGKLLPYDPPADPEAVFKALQAEYPQAEAANAAIAQDAVVSQQLGYAWLRPSLLDGVPGVGKTRYARRAVEVSGLRYLLHSASGSHDASIAGTSAAWASARLSAPAQAVLMFERANVCLIVDEIDKAGTSTHNGRMDEALLPFLERETSRRIIDPMLELPLDLSCMTYVMTDNDLHRVSGPLRDRLRVLHIPKPRAEHLPLIAKTMVADMRAETGVDERWMPDLDGDELDLLSGRWKGGSMRRLRRLVEVLVLGRDGLAPRH